MSDVKLIRNILGDLSKKFTKMDNTFVERHFNDIDTVHQKYPTLVSLSISDNTICVVTAYSNKTPYGLMPLTLDLSDPEMMNKVRDQVTRSICYIIGKLEREACLRKEKPASQ